MLCKEIQQRTQSAYFDFDKARAAKNAILIILAMFSFFHHDGISEDISSNAVVQRGQKNRWLDFLLEMFDLPVASYKLNHKLLPLTDAGVCNKLIFEDGIQLVISFCFIKFGSHN